MAEPVDALEPAKVPPSEPVVAWVAPMPVLPRPGTANDDTVGRVASAFTTLCVFCESVEAPNKLDSLVSVVLLVDVVGAAAAVAVVAVAPVVKRLVAPPRVRVGTLGLTSVAVDAVLSG